MIYFHSILVLLELFSFYDIKISKEKTKSKTKSKAYLIAISWTNQIERNR